VPEPYVDKDPVPLPDPNYPWEYPISAEYYQWYQISGPWPYNDAGVGISGYNASGTNFNPYSKAPTTSHVIWKHQVDKGALLGGDQGYLGMRGFRPRPVAAQGRIYWTTDERNTLDGEQVGRHPVLWCYDQFTGELIYRRDLPGEGNPGKLYLEIVGREGEVDPKLGVRDPLAFSLWMTVGYGQTGGTWEVDPWDGDTLYYNPDLTGWRPAGSYLYLPDYNGTSGEEEDDVMTKWDCRTKQVEWVKPISGFRSITPDRIVQRTSSRGGIPNTMTINVWDTATGDPIVLGEPTGVYAPASEHVVAYGKTYRLGMDRRVYAFSLTTGKIVWRSEQIEDPWGAFGMYWAAAAYNKIFQGTYDGHIYAINEDDGTIAWKYFLGETTFSAAGTYTPWGGCWIADGKVYVATSEHSPPNPDPRGHKLYCLDANSGDFMWSFPFHCSSRGAGGISSGMLWVFNRYDNSLYMFGKGPSATTVSASPSVIAKGESVLIQGTVTDQSSGAKDTPAIADEDQSEWMQYLYQNKPEPADATGVPVSVCAIASDGTVIDIGQTTSTSSGQFSKLWTPPDQDTYRIIASFDASGSYYNSWAETNIGVTEAPPTPTDGQTNGDTEPEPAGLGATELAIIAAGVIIAIVALVIAFWALRKRE
jgi:outer membrane protein assembly factor BamB